MPQGTLLQVPEGLLPGTSSFLLLVREGSDSSSEPLPPRAPAEPSGYCPSTTKESAEASAEKLWIEGFQQGAAPMGVMRVMTTLPLQGKPDSRQVHYAS